MNFYRFISPQDKTIIVLEGLSGKPMKEICRDYRITEFQYRRWRKHFLLHSPRVFDWDFEDLCRNRAKVGIDHFGSQVVYDSKKGKIQSG